MKTRVLTISKPYIHRSYRDKLIELSKQEDLEIGLICPTQWGPHNFEKDESGSENYWMKTLPIRMNGKNHFHTYKNLSNAIKEFKPDILNLEEEHYSLVTLQGYRIAKKMGIKSIFYTWQNINKNYPFPFSQIEQYVFENSAAAVGGNKESIDILREKGYKNLAVEIPQMGVTIDRFAPKESSLEFKRKQKQSLNLDPESFWIIFAGRIVEEKGLDELVEAVKKINNPKLKVLILGDGPYRPNIKEKAASLNLEDQFKFIQQVPSTEVVKYLQAADVMCLPSRTEKNWKEQFGRIIVESMAAEAIVVGSSSGEISNVIGSTGLVFKERDSDSLQKELSKLLSSPELCQNLREEASKRVRENFSTKIIAKKFSDLFTQIAKMPSP